MGWASLSTQTAAEHLLWQPQLTCWRRFRQGTQPTETSGSSLVPSVVVLNLFGF